MVKQAVERSVERPVKAVLDWKGLGNKKGDVVRALDDAGIENVRIKDFLK
jgi:hypothetical protein